MKLAALILLILTAGVLHAGYEPQEGDICFQSLSHNPVIDAIEGATESPYSHCGILVKNEGEWYVLEAIGPVKETPIKKWILQARDNHFDVYRLKEPYRQHIPAMIEAAKKYKGRPYDIRYQMDDEKIYCSELVFKAYRDATGEELGKLVKLGDLKWPAYTLTILAIEGSLPLNRIMITPRHLSEAEQLELVYSSKDN